MRPRWLWFCFTVLTLIKLWLVSGQTLVVNCGETYDDRLFLNIANHLLDGRWLGPYDQFTLAKGMFYPLWIAVMHFLNVPLLLSQHLLYIAACFITIVAIKPIVRTSAILLLIFIVLLFNPMSYSDYVMTVTLREGIYPALTLLIVAFAIGFLIRHKQSCTKLIPWTVGLGLTFSAFWLTREEGIWIVPFMLFVVGLTAVKMWQTKPVDWRKLSVCVVLPFAIWFTSIGAVAGLNKIHYGIFATVEFKWPDFLAAYGALSRVKHAHWQPTIPVPKETRERIYNISPTFTELNPFLETDKRWEDILRRLRMGYEKDPEVTELVRMMLRLNSGNSSRDPWIQMWNSGSLFSGEIPGGWFLWVFRDAVAAAGYYSSGASAANYYRRLASEINAACRDGRLKCYARHATLMPPWHNAYNIPLIRTFFASAAFLVRFENFSVKFLSGKDQEDPLSICGMRKTERHFLFQDFFPRQVEMYAMKTRILKSIGRIFQFTIPVLCGLGLAIYILDTIQLLRKRTIPISWIINSGLLVAIGARLFVISLIHVTSFPGVTTRYLVPAYPLLLFFVVMSLTSIISYINRRSLLSTLYRIRS
jgi:hypothetical protein